MNEQIENILRNPSVLKTAEGDGYTDETAAKWAWFAHGYDTGMEPFYSIDQLREAVRAAIPPEGGERKGEKRGGDVPRGGEQHGA